MTPSKYEAVKHGIVILNIEPYSQTISNLIEPFIKQYYLSFKEFDSIWDYCIAHALHDCLQVQVQGYVLNLPSSDIAKVIYQTIKPTLLTIVKKISESYGLYFFKGETLKVMSTLNEIIIVRYF